MRIVKKKIKPAAETLLPIHCAHDAVVLLSDLQPHPRNPNKHPEAQIELLMKIMKHQGWRAPIVVSNRSKYIVAGHARLESARRLGLLSAPVNHQDFKSQKDELAHLVADNRIAELATTDTDILKLLFQDVKGFDLDLLGYNQEGLDAFFALAGQLPPSGIEVDPDWNGMPEFNHLDKSSWRHLVVHFSDEAGLKQFQKITKTVITDRTRYIWFPRAEAHVKSGDLRWKTKDG